MNSFLQTLRNLGPLRLGAIGGVTLALIGFFLFVTLRLSSPQMALLYSDLDSKDAGAITAKLDAAQVPYQVSSDGSRIMVPADEVGKLRMTMAQAGLPNGGSIGYEIFDKPQGLGTTAFIESINQLRALEGELARTISTLDQIQQARVQLVLPKRELFSQQEQTATASVFVKLRPGKQLGAEQIAAIRQFVAAAVPKLNPNRIAIIDDRGNLLARGDGASADDAMTSTADEKRLAYQRHLADGIEALLAKTLGYGKVRAEVTADLDFDQVTTNSETFNPDSQVVRSTQSVNDKNQSTDQLGANAVTVNTNLPNNQGSTANSGTTGSNSSHAEETTNYEIDKTVTNHVRALGQVRRLSVAVLVDGTYAPGKDGKPVYTPRPPQEMAQIKTLVESAIGYDATRGDTVDVVNMRFAPPEDAGMTSAEAGGLFGLSKADIVRIAEIVVLGIVAVLVMLLVVRPLLNRALESRAGGEDGDRLLTDQSGVQMALAGPAGSSALNQDLALQDAADEDELEQMIDINRVEGRVRASSLRKVGEIVEKHPESAAAIIRAWMYQET